MAFGTGIRISRNSKRCFSIDKVAMRSTDQFQCARRTMDAVVVAVLQILSKKIIVRTVPSRRRANMDMNPSISAGGRDQRYRNELGWIDCVCLELDQSWNTDGSFHATRDECERCNDVCRNTTATSAHIEHLEVCAEFRQTRNAVTASNAAYPFTFFSHISDSNGSDRSSRSISRKGGRSSDRWHDQTCSSSQGRNSSWNFNVRFSLATCSMTLITRGLVAT